MSAGVREQWTCYRDNRGCEHWREAIPVRDMSNVIDLAEARQRKAER